MGAGPPLLLSRTLCECYVHCPFACWRTLMQAYASMLPGRSMLLWVFVCKFYEDMIFIPQRKHGAWVSGLCEQWAFCLVGKKTVTLLQEFGTATNFHLGLSHLSELYTFSLDTWMLGDYRTDVWPAWANWITITETLVFGYSYWLWALGWTYQKEG